MRLTGSATETFYTNLIALTGRDNTAVATTTLAMQALMCKIDNVPLDSVQAPIFKLETQQMKTQSNTFTMDCSEKKLCIM